MTVACILLSLLLYLDLVSGTTYLRGVGGSGAAGGRPGLRQWYALHQSQHVSKLIIGNTQRQQRKLPRHFVPGHRAEETIGAFNEAPLNQHLSLQKIKTAGRKRAPQNLTLPCESL